MNNNKITEGLVLQTMTYSEADIIGALIAESGVIRFIAPGAKRSKKRMLGSIEFLDNALFEFSPPRKNGGLSVLTQIVERKAWKSLHSSHHLSNSFFCIACLFAEFILAMRNTEEDTKQIFTCLMDGLVRLDSSQSIHELLGIFANTQVVFLRILGIDPAESPKFKFLIISNPNVEQLITINRQLIHYAEDYIGYELKSRKSLESTILR